MRWRFAEAGLIALSLVGSGPLRAQPANGVAQARAAGIVGERFDGYLGLVIDGGPLLRHQVAAINIRRRSLYAELAERRQVTLQEIGMTAACQLLGTVGEGERYFGTDNVWHVRAPGEPPPIPPYCR